jgi:hypothetical protein
MAGKKSGLMLLCIRQGHTVGYIITDNNLPYSMLFSMKKRIISTGKFFTSSSIEVKKRRGAEGSLFTSPDWALCRELLVIHVL